MRAVVLASLVAFFATPTNAAMFCSEPSEPYCLDTLSNSDDEWAFNSCRSEVESFVDDTNRYTQCLADERNEAVKKANDAVERFNCKARRQGFCP